MNDFCNEIQFIIQVVNENEYQAAVTLMKPPSNTSFEKAVVYPQPGFMVGMFANKKTALIFTSEGSDCSDYVYDALTDFPKAQFVISIGVGYAFDSTKQKLGDVLVSEQICDLKNLQLGPNKIVESGQRIDVVEELAEIFCEDLSHEFEVSDIKRYANTHAGQFASFPAIIDSQDVRDEIHHSLPEAIGGDVEGGELLKFQSKGEIKGVALIKGVSNYADGNRGIEWEFTATSAALHYAHFKLIKYQSECFIN